jgi:hypothetical protein
MSTTVTELMLNLKTKFVYVISDLNEWKDNLHLDKLKTIILFF